MNALERRNALRLLSIIVVEARAPWPIPELEDEQLEIDRVVLAQQTGENPRSFSDRVIARLAALTEHGAAVRVAVIATRDNESLLDLESRERVARALIAARARETTAGLVLIGRASRHPRHDLFALAGSLCRSLRDDFYVRVRMVKPSPRVHPMRSASSLPFTGY